MLSLQSSKEEIWEAMNRPPGSPWPNKEWVNWPNVKQTFAWAVGDYLENGVPKYPGHEQERGIVICAGGKRLFTNAWVCINMLRYHGVTLPIQMWHLGPQEMDQKMRDLVEPLGVTVVDAAEYRLYQDPVRILAGFEVKPFALKNCPFREVMLLDADNMTTQDPLYLFDTPQYKEKGVILWPDYGRLEKSRGIWDATGVPYRDEQEVESGQIVMDRERSWKSICLTVFLNEYSDFVYQHVHGDKETFHFGFHRSGQGYAMPEKVIQSLENKVMCQHDFDDERIFQHRNMDKWKFDENNQRISGFRYETKCFKFIQELRDQWDGEISPTPAGKKRNAEKEKELAGHVYRYERMGHDKRLMLFLDNGVIGDGVARMEQKWMVFSGEKTDDEEEPLELWINGEDGLTCRLALEPDGVWRGKWERHEQMPIEITLIK